MLDRNPDRNFLIYELWKKGHTVDEISLETCIPRSTVGYYVRKFNKCARSGEPIICQRVREEPDEKTLALIGFAKSSFFVDLMKVLKEEDGLDKVYKRLMIVKLIKELQTDIFPTEEEKQAFRKNPRFLLEQILLAKKSAST